jgi:hypothetical protein
LPIGTPEMEGRAMTYLRANRQPRLRWIITVALLPAWPAWC